MDCLFIPYRYRFFVLFYVPLAYKHDGTLWDSLSCLESLGNSLPVDNVPDGVKVLGLAVLVLEVVCVLPSVDAEKRDVVARHGVLVGTSDDLQSSRALVLGQPRPAAALDTRECGVNLLPKLVDGAKVLLDGRLEGARRVAATGALTGRSQVFPEEGVVDMATAVEVEEWGSGGGGVVVVGGLGLGDGVERTIEAVDVGLVVVLVV